MQVKFGFVRALWLTQFDSILIFCWICKNYSSQRQGVNSYVDWIFVWRFFLFVLFLLFFMHLDEEFLCISWWLGRWSGITHHSGREGPASLCQCVQLNDICSLQGIVKNVTFCSGRFFKDVAAPDEEHIWIIDTRFFSLLIIVFSCSASWNSWLSNQIYDDFFTLWMAGRIFCQCEYWKDVFLFNSKKLRNRALESKFEKSVCY